MTVYFCRLEYLTPEGWEVGHHGINLLHPEKYVTRLAARGKIGRVTIVDTGEVFQSACEVCDASDHTAGECLL